MTHENYINHTDLLVVLRTARERRGRELLRIRHILHYHELQAGGDIRNYYRQREAIRREREKLRLAHEAEKRREWAAELVREIFNHKSFKRLIRSLQTHGLWPRTQGKKSRRGRGLNPGGVPRPWRKTQGRADKGKSRTLVACNRV